MTINGVNDSMKRIALFLFAGFFAAAMLQPASAQNSGPNGNSGSPPGAKDNHTVKINVNYIDKIAPASGPSITVGAGDLKSWGATGSSSFDVTTNSTSGRTINISSVSVENNSLSNLGLAVEASNLPDGGSKNYNSEIGDVSGFLISPTDGNNTNSGKFVEGFSQVYNHEVSLTYKANASVNYNPDNTTKVKITYTLTTN